jgi:hypothetical protein
MSPSRTYGPGIEAAGCLAKMAHPAKAKVMMGNVHTRAWYLRQDR